MTKKPNYTDMGFARSMGPKLRHVVEEQLSTDLKNYFIDTPGLKFDWSDSCIEGKSTDYLDGSIDCYSSIYVFDNNDNLVADGWMEFIHDGNFFLVYWDMVTTYHMDKVLADKKTPGIPDHIWAKIPDDIKPNYIDDRQKSTTA
jgi:hypothetical protein